MLLFWRCRNLFRKQSRERTTHMGPKAKCVQEISNRLSFAPCGGKHSTCSWFFELVDDDRRADKANQAKEHGRDGVGQPCDHCAYHSGTHRQNHPSYVRQALPPATDEIADFGKSANTTAHNPENNLTLKLGKIQCPPTPQIRQFFHPIIAPRHHRKITLPAQNRPI